MADRIEAILAEPPASAPVEDSGEEVLATVRAVQGTLHGLLEHERLLGAEVLADVQKTVDEVSQRLARERLLVVVVGERGCGKSTLLDAIVGDRLLGSARGQSSVVTFLHHHPVPSYRARFSNGSVDDFSRRVPDTVKKLELHAERVARALADSEQLCRSNRSALRRAIEARERAERDEQQARSGVVGARELEGAAGSELSGLEEEASRLDQAVGEVELRVPELVRTPPPRWALWSWLVHTLYLLFRRRVWQHYRSLLGERDTLRERLAARRDLVQEAARARALAEAGLQPLGTDADYARLHSGEVEQALRDAETERDRLRGELEGLHSQREHYQSERFREFFSELQTLSRRRDLVELEIDYPAKHLPDDVTIVDIPGLVSATDPEWQLIRERADGCILVSELNRAVSEATKQFLRQLREVVPHLLLVLTKMDQAYEDAVRRGAEQPWDEVELARRIGTRRFARELGRDPSSVLSISVAAEAALSAGDSELGGRFDGEVDKLFQLLRRERALIVGARAAEALHRCIASFAEAEAAAERAYRERIATLERQRTPEPDVFKQQLLTDIEGSFEASANDAVAQASTAMANGFLLLRRLCEQEVAASATSGALVALTEKLAHDLSERVVGVQRDAYLELDANVERAVAKIEQGLFQAVRTRYQLLHEVRRTAVSSPRLSSPAEEHPDFGELVPKIQRILAAFKQRRLILGASGSLAGAASGALVHPWLGAAAGAALGGLLAFARREKALAQQVQTTLTEALTEQQEQYGAKLKSETEAVAARVRASVERSLERALIHFARWIKEPLEAERQAIEAERQKLVLLETLRDQVSARDRDLEASLKAATLRSVGLCR